VDALAFRFFLEAPLTQAKGREKQRAEAGAQMAAVAVTGRTY